MKPQPNFPEARAKSIVQRAIKESGLELKGLTVLTEAATNNFAVTAAMAATAGAHVLAVARDSRHGAASEARVQTRRFAELCGVDDRIDFLPSAKEGAGSADIITNLGSLRPIDKGFVRKLRVGAVIPLMYSSWEFRNEDLDIGACNSKEIPVMGTDESEAGANVFRFCGPLCAKLLFESGVEVMGNKIVILSSDAFGTAIRDYLIMCGADVTLALDLETPRSRRKLKGADCIVVADYSSDRVAIGQDGQVSASEVARLAPDTIVLNLAGIVRADEVSQSGLAVYPHEEPGWRRMTRTLADLGPLPLIELHAAGLRVGEIMHRAKEKGIVGERFVAYVKKHSSGEPLVGAKY